MPKDQKEDAEAAQSFDDWTKAVGESMVKSLSDWSPEKEDEYFAQERAERRRMLEAAGGQIDIPKKQSGDGA